MPRKKIEAKPIIKNGKPGYSIIIPKELGGGRVFKATKKEADEVVKNKEAERRGKIDKLFTLRPAELAEISLALEILDWRTADLVAAAKAHATRHLHAKRTVEQVAEECVAVKVAANCRPRYTEALAAALARFARFVGPKQMHEITREDVERFVTAPKTPVKGQKKPVGDISPWTKKSRRTDVSTLFSFAVPRGYCRENLAAKIEKIRTDETEIGILTVPQCRALLAIVREKHPSLIPFVALCLFGGLRPSEAQQLRWDDIGESITVAAERSKGRRRRLVTLNPTLRAWLALGGDLPVSEPKSRVVRELLTPLPWPKDGLRHSFCSYHFATFGGMATAREAGNSESVLFRHYRELVTPAAAEAFWKIRPENV